MGNQIERLWLSADVTKFQITLISWFIDPFRSSKYVDCWYQIMSLNYSTEGVYSSSEGKLT